MKELVLAIGGGERWNLAYNSLFFGSMRGIDFLSDRR